MILVATTYGGLETATTCLLRSAHAMSMLLPGDRMGITCKTIWDEIKKDATRISYALHPDIIRIK